MKKNNTHNTVNTFAVELAYQQQTLALLDLHGHMPDVVESEMDRFLVRTYHSGAAGCGIICGYGKGVMRQRVLELLRPYTKSTVGAILDQGSVVLIVFHR